jgi:hypothetical protein
MRVVAEFRDDVDGTWFAAPEARRPDRIAKYVHSQSQPRAYLLLYIGHREAQLVENREVAVTKHAAKADQGGKRVGYERSASARPQSHAHDERCA